MTCVQQFSPLCLADVRACLSDSPLQSALSSVQPVCPSVFLLRRQGRAVRESGMPRLFGKCQCAALAITEAGFACV